MSNTIVSINYADRWFQLNLQWSSQNALCVHAGLCTVQSLLSDVNKIDIQKVNITLEQVMKSQRRSAGIALFFL